VIGRHGEPPHDGLAYAETAVYDAIIRINVLDLALKKQFNKPGLLTATHQEKP
jgi:hypothetical protein